jgi:hypothetical protein
MTVRLATKNDTKAIAELIKEFHSVSPANAFPLDEPSLLATITALIRNPTAFVVVYEVNATIVGSGAFLLTPILFNRALYIANEIYFYVKPSNRGIAGPKLLTAMEKAGKVKGAVGITMYSLTTFYDKKLASFYKRRGYRPDENRYIKFY